MSNRTVDEALADFVASHDWRNMSEQQLEEALRHYAESCREFSLDEVDGVLIITPKQVCN